MPNLKKSNIAHVATFFNFKLKRISTRKFTPSPGKPNESMGRQKVTDLRYYIPSASTKVNLREAQLQAYNLLDFVFDNKDKFQAKWHDKYNTNDKRVEGYSNLTAIMAQPSKTVFDIAEKLDELIKFKGEEDAAAEALNADDNSFNTEQDD